MRLILALCFFISFSVSGTFPKKDIPLIIVNDFFYPDTPFAHGNLMVSIIQKRLEKLGLEEERDYYLQKASYVNPLDGAVEEISTNTYVEGKKVDLFSYIDALKEAGHSNIIINMSYVDSTSMDDYEKRQLIHAINKKLFHISKDITINKASGNNQLKSFLRGYIKDLSEHYGLPEGFEQLMAKTFISNLHHDSLRDIIKSSHEDINLYTQYNVPIQYINDIFNIFLREYEVFGQVVEFYRYYYSEGSLQPHHFNLVYSVKSTTNEEHIGFINAINNQEANGPRSMSSTIERTNHPFFEYATPYDYYSHDNFFMDVAGKKVLLQGTSAATALKSADDAMNIRLEQLVRKLASLPLE